MSLGFGYWEDWHFRLQQVVLRGMAPRIGGCECGNRFLRELCSLHKCLKPVSLLGNAGVVSSTNCKIENTNR